MTTYTLAAGIYIVLSDWLLTQISQQIEALQMLSTLKGLGFVVVTSVVLYSLIYRNQVARQSIEDQRQQINRRLTESEGRFRSAFERAPVGILLIEMEGLILRANSEISRLLGFSPDELTRLSYDDLLHPDDRELSSYIFFETKEEQLQNFDQELRLVAKDGSTLWAQVRSTTVYSADDLPMHRIINILDITGRKTSDEKLRASEARYRSLFEQAADCILIVNSEGKVSAANHAACELLGYSNAEITGMPVDNLFTSEQRAQIECMIDELIAGKVFIFRYELAARNGGSIPAEVSIHMLPEGAIQAIARDLRPRLQAEQELRKQKETLETILDNLPVIVQFFDADGRLQLANRSLEKILGYSVEETKNSDILRSQYPDPAELEKARVFIDRADGTWSKFNVRHKNGLVREMLWNNLRLSDNRIVGIGLDVTETIRTQDSLRKTRETVISLSARLAAAEEAQRKRFASEPSDQAGQKLAELMDGLGAALVMLDQQDSAGVRLRLAESISLLSDTIESMRGRDSAPASDQNKDGPSQP